MLCVPIIKIQHPTCFSFSYFLVGWKNPGRETTLTLPQVGSYEFALFEASPSIPHTGSFIVPRPKNQNPKTLILSAVENPICPHYSLPKLKIKVKVAKTNTDESNTF